MPKLIPSALAVVALAAIGCAPTAGPAAADGPRHQAPVADPLGRLLVGPPLRAVGDGRPQRSQERVGTGGELRDE